MFATFRRDFLPTMGLPLLGLLALVGMGLTSDPISHANAQRRGRRVRLAIQTSAEVPVLNEALRDALEEELDSTDGLRIARRSRYTLRAAVTKLEQEDAQRIECEVSVVLEDRGNVRAVLNGRSAGQGRLNDNIQGRLVRAAVRGALRPLRPTLAQLR